MKIAIGGNTFVRSVNEDVLFSNPKSGANFVVNDCKVLADALSKEFKSIEKILSVIANACNIDIVDATSDFMPIIEDLISEGLLVTSESNNVDEHGRVIAQSKYKSTSDIVAGEGDPLGKFYSDRQLPLALHMDITSCCTERCVQCYLPDYPNKHIPYNFIEKVLHEFKGLAGLTVYISGGECMAHPDFRRILSLCRAMDMNIVILSNLTLCDNDMVRFLKEISPQYVNVSLYSTKSEEHDAITTIKGSCEKTLNAISRCLKEGVNIRIAAPLLKMNRYAFHDLQNFANNHNIHLVPDFTIISKCNHDGSNLQYACSAEELKEVLAANKEIFDMGWAKNCRNNPDATICDIGLFKVHLNSKGDYYPCPSMHGYVLGNCRDYTLQDIWYSGKINYLRNIRWKHLPKCVNCDKRTFCEPCIAYNFNATGDLFKVVPEKCAMATVVKKIYEV